MKSTPQKQWKRFQNYYSEYPSIGLALDISRMNFPEDFLLKMEPRIQKAFVAMHELERGAIANPDENRMVGHYWLRDPSLAPTQNIKMEIEETLAEIKTFVEKIHQGVIRGQGGVFTHLLVIGIGGSALGPQFVSAALGHPRKDKMGIRFIDNTDPDGMDRVFSTIPHMDSTLCLVISKSGATPETRNGMLETRALYRKLNFHFESHSVAITAKGSALDNVALEGHWLARFPMWDWVGGRTSVLSAVGLLPAALQGFDIAELLTGARECDMITRISDVTKNPAAKLALMWFWSGNGKGTKDMVILPYKDRLELFSKYLQQLIMESLGKEKDRHGNLVHQGLAVYGNKGSTDQHAYIQQLRDGLNNFFVTFIEVLQDGVKVATHVEPKVTSGDFLEGFLLGTRRALHEKGRESVTLTIEKVSPFSVGVLIALFERAVGFYASLVDVNAYHQPGVEAGKTAAARILELQLKTLNYLTRSALQANDIDEIASAIGEDDVETIFKICAYLAANGRLQNSCEDSPFTAKYSAV